MDEVKLLPCAHCGSSDVELRKSIMDACIACNNCGCRTGYVYFGPSDASNAYRKHEVAKVWNTRPTLVTDELVERVAALRETKAALQLTALVESREDVGDCIAEIISRLDHHIAAIPTLGTGQLDQGLGYWGPDVDGDWVVNLLGVGFAFAVADEEKAQEIVGRIRELTAQPGPSQ